MRTKRYNSPFILLFDKVWTIQSIKLTLCQSRIMATVVLRVLWEYLIISDILSLI